MIVTTTVKSLEYNPQELFVEQTFFIEQDEIDREQYFLKFRSVQLYNMG